VVLVLGDEFKFVSPLCASEEIAAKYQKVGGMVKKNFILDMLT
jgi:hypothetical protein